MGKRKAGTRIDKSEHGVTDERGYNDKEEWKEGYGGESTDVR